MTTNAVLYKPEHLEILRQVQALCPEIKARVDEIEKNSAVPQDLLTKLEKAGAFRMCVPKAFGGPEVGVRLACDVLEQVAAADASTAWHIMVAIGSQVITSRLPLSSLKEYYSTGPDVWPKASLAPKGIAVAVEGGYRLSGRWPLASGARPYEWVSVGFFIKDKGGMRMSADGKRPEFRCCLIPREGVTEIATWDATGLRGTRSDDLEIKDAFVPEAWQGSLFGPSNFEAPMYKVRMPVVNGPYFAAIAIGNTRAALAELATTALTRRPAFNPTALMRDDPVFRSRFGELAIRFEAMRALYDDAIATLEQASRERRDVSDLEAGRLSATVAFVCSSVTGILDEVIALAGAGAVYCNNSLQRRWRDARCAAQHQSSNIGLYSDFATELINQAAGAESQTADRLAS